MRPQSPTGRPYSSAAPAGPEGLGCNRRCVGVVSLCARNPPRGARIPPRPRQDRRDSGVTAAVWGRDLTVCPQSPTGRPYPSTAQVGPEGLGCNRRCVGEGPLRVPTIPHGSSLSLRGPGRTRGTRLQPPLCGGGQFVCPESPTGRPYPSAAQAGPEGLGCNRRCVGEGPLRVPTIPHGASLSLRGPSRTGGTWVQALLCEVGQFVCPKSPTGRPYPSAAQARPEGLGCNRRCVGEGPLRVPTIPHGASLSLRGPGRTGGTRV